MKKAIGVIGTKGAGKDTVAEYFADKFKIPSYSISRALKDILVERGMDITRENLTVLGREVAHEHGLGYLAERIFEQAPDFFVISGMRQVPQITFLREHTHFFLIAVDAHPEVRFKRTQERGDVREAKDLAHFIETEQQENSGDVQRVFDCMKLADAR